MHYFENDLELTIAQVIKKYNLLENKKKSKSFGQHFLCDHSLLKKIVLSAGKIEDSFDVIEIGPGPGGLTRAILELIPEKSNFFAIEKDINLKPVHDNIKKYSNKNIEFIYGDALNIMPQNITKKKVIIISNLPYNVGTQILLNWLTFSIENIHSMVLMFQKEVAERICSKINEKSYGRLSIITQLLCKTEKLFDVSNLAFYPPPKVTSSIVKLTPTGNSIDLKIIEELSAKCFQSRRKTIQSILKTHYKNIQNIEKFLSNFNINPQQRPETISPEIFLKLANTLYKNC